MNIAMHVTETSGVRTYELSTDKALMRVTIARSYVSTLVINAAHRAWNGSGKTFHGIDALNQAKLAYKSETSKAMVDLVIQEEKRRVSKESC